MLPGLAYIFVFYFKLGVAGLWYSPIITYGALTVIFGLKLSFSNYEELCNSFQKNLSQNEIVRRSIIKSYVNNPKVILDNGSEDNSIIRKEDFI